MARTVEAGSGSVAPGEVTVWCTKSLVTGAYLGGFGFRFDSSAPHSALVVIGVWGYSLARVPPPGVVVDVVLDDPSRVVVVVLDEVVVEGATALASRAGTVVEVVVVVGSASSDSAAAAGRPRAITQGRGP